MNVKIPGKRDKNNIRQEWRGVEIFHLYYYSFSKETIVT